jgi:Leucine-rich repeat (LRR) protein
MKRVIAILLLGVMLLAGIACNGGGGQGATVVPDTVVTFPDSNLDAAIREAINKASGDIYQSDLDGLTILYTYEGNISDLSGIEHCINLQRLCLDDNKISDISALSGLTNLFDLYLSGNQISDISALLGLTKLQQLILASNQIGDISALSGLINLQLLYLWSNNISDISALSGLTNLVYIKLGSNNISDISALSGLTNLLALDISGNQISNIQPLVTNTGIASGDEVYLGSDPLSEASINTYLPQLISRGVDIRYFSSE